MPPTARLYAPAHIGVASILGSPVAGGLLLFLNERRLGRPGAAVRMLLVGVLLAAATFAAAWLIPSPVGRITPALGALVYEDGATRAEARVSPALGGSRWSSSCMVGASPPARVGLGWRSCVKRLVWCTARVDNGP